MRIHTNLTQEDRERVKEYAKDRGLRMERAYTELIRKGLKNASQEDN